MDRRVFIPRRDVRHRIAAIALYRALIRTGQKIPLPQDLHPKGPAHPIVHIIRKRVSKNKNFSTPRLVYSSMAAGYRFLTLLTKAQSATNPEYDMVINHLRERAKEAAESRRIYESNCPPRPKKRKPVEPKPPLLTRISGPGEPLKYISTVRPQPKSMFKGDRKIPVLSGTADGLPYLRTMKPQPRILNQMLLQKKRVYLKRMWAVEDIKDFDESFARLEDNWDSLMRVALFHEGLTEPGPPEGHLTRYTRSQQLARLWLLSRVKAQWDDLIARGSAMNEIVEQEKTLATLEKAMPEWTEEQVKAFTAQVEAEFKARQSIKGTEHSAPVEDHYLSQEWQDIVARNEQRVFRGFSGPSHHGNSVDNRLNQRPSAPGAKGMRSASMQGDFDPSDDSFELPSLDELTRAAKLSQEPWTPGPEQSMLALDENLADIDFSINPFAEPSLKRRKNRPTLRKQSWDDLDLTNDQVAQSSPNRKKGKKSAQKQNDVDDILGDPFKSLSIHRKHI